jgi:hypothetical protein
MTGQARRQERTAANRATSAPKLDPTSATGPSGNASIVPTTCSTMRVMVRASKSSPFRSGHTSGAPIARAREVSQLALVDRGDEAKPCR